MNVARVIGVGIFTLLVVTLFVRQIVDQIRTGKFRPRGSKEYKTRKRNPIWYWYSIGAEILVILMALTFFPLRF